MSITTDLVDRLRSHAGRLRESEDPEIAVGTALDIEFAANLLWRYRNAGPNIARLTELRNLLLNCNERLESCNRCPSHDEGRVSCSVRDRIIQLLNED